MTDIPPPGDEASRIAARHFEYATRAEAGGDHALAIQSLAVSCRLAPANLAYRQALRKAEKARYGNNLRGAALAPLTTLFRRLRLRLARRRGAHLKVLEHGEAILARNPWDTAAQMHMAEAAVALGQPVLAIWLLQQAREKDGKHAGVNRALARLLEQKGYFQQAAALWELVRQAAPRDTEAQDKAKHLAATDTIARGNYEGAMAGGEITARAPLKVAAPAPQATRAPELPASLGAEGERASIDRVLQLAALSRRNGQIDEARALLRRGAEEAGPAVELALAEEDLAIEPLRQALARAEEQARARPGDAAREKARAELAVEVNTRELAWCRRRVEHDPADRAARLDLGVRLLRAGQLDDAIRELQAARSDPRLRCKALVQLGLCFEARQNWPLAKRNFEEALRHLPAGEEAQRKELLFHLAKGHADSGDHERAVELALDLANLDFGYRGISRLLDEWQARAGEAGRRP